MASGTIEEKIKRTKEGSQHRLSFLTGGVSVHNLCISCYFVFLFQKWVSITPEWYFFFPNSIEIDWNLVFLSEIDRDFWPQKWPFLGIFLTNFPLIKGGGSGAPKLPKMCVFYLKNDFFAEKDRKKSQKTFQKISSILDIEGSKFSTIEILSPGFNAFLVSILLKPFRLFCTIFSICDLSCKILSGGR